MSAQELTQVAVGMFQARVLGIERMRRDIEWLINTVLGLISDVDKEKYRSVQAGDGRPKGAQSHLVSGGYRWRIDFNTTSNKGPVWVSQVELFNDSTGEVIYRLSKVRAVEPSHYRVVFIYSARQGFLDWTREIFPSVKAAADEFLRED